MPFSKFAEDFLRPKPKPAFLIFSIAHLIALLICMIYPAISLVNEGGNFMFADFFDTLQWFFYYSFPAFSIASLLYVSDIFYAHRGFRIITYMLTLSVVYLTIFGDTGLAVKGHHALYGTAVLYVAGLFGIASAITHSIARKK